MNEIANKIKARRLELGLTLEDVAQAVGVGRSTVQRWESGLIKNMGRDKIAALAAILQMNPVELVPFGKFNLKAEVAGDELVRKIGLINDITEHSEGMIRKDDWARLEKLHQNPKLGILFDRAARISEEDMDILVQMAERMSKDIYGDD